MLYPIITIHLFNLLALSVVQFLRNLLFIRYLKLCICTAFDCELYHSLVHSLLILLLVSRKRVSGEREHFMIMEREKRLKAALDKLAGVRLLIRKNRVKHSIPTVAVVGYTNSGKLPQ